MNILLVLPGFIFSFLVVLLYECRIRLLRRQRNNVHFYVARDKDGKLWLYIGKPYRGRNAFYNDLDKGCGNIGCYNLKIFGLNKNDYANLKWEDEPIEVFLNMEN